jgi:endonuclease G
MLSVLTTILLLTTNAWAWDQRANNPITACADELPFGIPIATTPNTTLECREGYALQHDNVAKIAIWAGWTIPPEETIGCNPREDAFVADQALPKGARAEPGDYAKSGYDKGHMVPDADLSWSKITSLESFLMSNMSPQFPNLNRGAWKILEAQTRAWAWSRKHPLTVYSGNIYKLGVSKTIGENKVVVPDALFKIVIDDVTGETLAFHFPNVEKQSTELKPRLMSVSEIERLTGATFPTPPAHDKALVALDLWPGSQGEVAEAKKSACKVKR